MAKSKTTKKPKPLEVDRRSDEEMDAAIAKAILTPSVQAAITTKSYSRQLGDRVELPDLVEALKEQTKATKNGNMGRAEEMLTAQAHTLDAIFNRMAQQAAQNIGHYPETVERYLKIALRAQSQSRATWEALSTIKHPPMANYVGQANISSGPQQINNGMPSRARENETEQSKQSGANDELLPHTRAPSLPGQDDSSLEAVGEIDRAKVTRG